MLKKHTHIIIGKKLKKKFKTYDTKRKSKRTFYALPQPYPGHWRRTWTGDSCIYPGKALRSVCSKGGAKATFEHLVSMEMDEDTKGMVRSAAQIADNIFEYCVVNACRYDIQELEKLFNKIKTKNFLEITIYINLFNITFRINVIKKRHALR